VKYSQHEEEGVINSLFGDKGRFLDVGAFDGKTFSNTLRLYERGWSGVLVEPSPNSFAGLKRTYDWKPHVVLINAAVAKWDGTISFFDSGGDAISSTDFNHKEKWEKGHNCKFSPIEVASISFETLFKEYGFDYDFVSIDTEATNLEVLKMFPFDKCNPMCLCIEHDGMYGQIADMLSPLGHREVHRNGENLIFYRGPR